MVTTAMPVATGVNVHADSHPDGNAGRKSKLRPGARWLPWSIGGGIAAVLRVIGLLVLRSGRSAQEKNEFSSSASGSESAFLSPEFTNSIGMRMKLIPTGEFLMGSPANESGRDSSEGPQHRVQITHPFYFGIYEVTQGQWESVMRTTPWKWQVNARDGNDIAATFVSWEDAAKFCTELTLDERQSGQLAATEVYHLPTEAEWEYACRAGSTTSWSFGNDATELATYGWFENNARSPGHEYPHAVGDKLANSWGLYDIHGNVGEWCSDWFDHFSHSTVGITADPQGPVSGSQRVNRGGSWYSTAQNARSAFRISDGPEVRFSFIGFRAVRTIVTSIAPDISTARSQSRIAANAPGQNAPSGLTSGLTNSVGMRMTLGMCGKCVTTGRPRIRLAMLAWILWDHQRARAAWSVVAVGVT